LLGKLQGIRPLGRYRHKQNGEWIIKKQGERPWIKFVLPNAVMNTRLVNFVMNLPQKAGNCLTR
jgi:hypothetical protein